MEKIFTWKKGVFKRTVEILSGETVVGSMKEYNWRNSAHAEMNGKAWFFRNRGFFQRTAEVRVLDTEEVVLTITYKTWSSKATIVKSDRPYHNLLWSFDNFWNTKATLSDPSGRSVKYHGGYFNGSIRSTIDDDLLILTGLFIMSYMRRRTAAAAS